MRVPLQHFQAAVAVVVLVAFSVGASGVSLALPDLAGMSLLARCVVAVLVLALVGGLLDALARPPSASSYNRVRSGDVGE